MGRGLATSSATLPLVGRVGWGGCRYQFKGLRNMNAQLQPTGSAYFLTKETQAAE